MGQTLISNVSLTLHYPSICIEYPSGILKGGFYNTTALHRCAGLGHYSCAHALLEFGADLNIQGECYLGYALVVWLMLRC